MSIFAKPWSLESQENWSKTGGHTCKGQRDLSKTSLTFITENVNTMINQIVFILDIWLWEAARILKFCPLKNLLYTQRIGNCVEINQFSRADTMDSGLCIENDIFVAVL